VITGTLAATAIAIFVIPMLFVVVERLRQRGHGSADTASGAVIDSGEIAPMPHAPEA
jgi:hypothetical protein